MIEKKKNDIRSDAGMEIEMAGIFSGLDKFGLGKLSGMNVFEEEKKEKAADGQGKEAVKEISEADLIFDKTFKCPCCDHEFKAKAVRAGKVKLVSMDSDLRPRYQQMDCLKYDAVVCPKCGYAALTRFFTVLTGAQAKLIKENISASFRGIKEEGDIYTYEDALNRHKLALVGTIVKRSKLSERAYTCLKLGWLLRGQAEELPKNTPNYDEVIKQMKTEELEALGNAYDGFSQAFSKEMFPMCGMDEHTTELLMADLARRLGKKEESSRWISTILVSRDCNERIKSKAREIKELLEAEKK